MSTTVKVSIASQDELSNLDSHAERPLDIPTTVDLLDAIAAKGTLLVGKAASQLVSKAVGTDGQALIADAASEGGMKWSNYAASDWDFVSSLQAIHAGGTVITVAHGLAGRPTNINADLVAVAETGEGIFGWTIGDYVSATANFHSSTYALNYIGADATNVYFFICAAGSTLIVPTLTTASVNVVSTLTNWNIRIKANYRP